MMDNFKEFTENKLIEDSLYDIMYIIESDNQLYESYLVEGKIEDFIKKSGLKLHKSTGLIKYLSKAGMGIAKMFVAAIRGDKQGVLDVVDTVKREDVIDFLLKLDMATLHIITGPIHFINAITGWDLEANISSHPNVVATIDTIKVMIDKIKKSLTNVSSLSKTKRKQFHGFLSKIDTSL